MEITVGKTYDVLIHDCCVEGKFVSKLIKAIKFDDDDNEYPVTKTDYETQIYFENGVELRTMNGVYLREVKEKE